MNAPYPTAYIEGVRLFNAGEYFACHDVLEELWNETLGPEREFYQGLIQAAVALYHFENGNLGGARRMYHSAVNYFQPYRPAFLGLDLERFLAQLTDCFRELLDAGNVYPAGAVLPADRAPRIELSDDARGGEPS